MALSEQHQWKVLSNVIVLNVLRRIGPQALKIEIWCYSNVVTFHTHSHTVKDFGQRPNLFMLLPLLCWNSMENLVFLGVINEAKCSKTPSKEAQYEPEIVSLQKVTPLKLQSQPVAGGYWWFIPAVAQYCQVKARLWWQVVSHQLLHWFDPLFEDGHCGQPLSWKRLFSSPLCETVSVFTSVVPNYSSRV